MELSQTEDDTFRILKKIPFREMHSRYHNFLDENSVRFFGQSGTTWTHTVNTEITPFFSKYGWTYQEYLDHIAKVLK